MPRMTKAEKAAIVEKTVAIGREMKRIANEGFKVLKGPFEAKYDDSLNIDIICAGEHFTHQIDPNKSIGDNFADFSKTVMEEYKQEKNHCKRYYYVQTRGKKWGNKKTVAIICYRLFVL